MAGVTLTRHAAPLEDPLEGTTSERDVKEVASNNVEELIFEQHRPYFCCFAIVVCSVVMIAEVSINGGVQPLSCPGVSPAGLPVHEDGSPCEANIMLGPQMAVLDALGAKNDAAIFEDGEWYRLLSCSWLHSGFVHLLLNVSGLYSLGFPLEAVFGFWRTAVLYLTSGVLGSMVSTILLPGVLSVGASASVFGLIGAYWADIVLNYCARCDLEDTGWKGLLLGSAINLLIGFTPWVDNFMHLGGFFTGLATATLLLPEIRVRATVVDPYASTQEMAAKVRVSALGRKRKPRVLWHYAGDRIVGHGAMLSRVVEEARAAAATHIQARLRGRLSRRGRPPRHVRLYRRLCGKINRVQLSLILAALGLLISLVMGTLAAMASGSTFEVLRTCKACQALNCIDVPWWSCCIASLPGSCVLEQFETTLIAQCNLSGVPLFNASCDMADGGCTWESESTNFMCQKLCFGC
jgi:membrane associated rhomboid family serine protease